MKISVIIPVVNEAEHLRRLIPHLQAGKFFECIVVDGGSTDESIAVAQAFNCKVIDAPRSRAKQMNEGAAAAVGDILYFVHADTLPPVSYGEDILAVFGPKTPFGCFRSRFNTNSRFLKINSYFSRFKGLMFRGGGQTLWVSKLLFNQLNGYDSSLKLMEEYDFIQRAQQVANYKVIQKDVLVSDRTYQKNGNFKTQFIYALVMFGFFRGIHQDRLLKFAKYWIK
ncbi:MAG: TIGR04283 family arsenosugar biosynthesis glycosyltransferase [Saprospiraceae bacterium]|nr:TIGR04283 family arsenosugar biosynthesis glycosyltransferase [Saprospiraceae bacterium]